MRKVVAALAFACAGLAATSAAAGEAAGCNLQERAQMRVTMRGSQPLVDVLLEGQKMSFLIDSGAFASILSAGAADKVGAFRFNAGEVTGIGGDAYVQLTKIKQLVIGGALVSNADFFVMDDGAETVGGADGIIGQNILGYHDVEYDLANGLVRLFTAVGCTKEPLAYWSQDYAELPIQAIGRESTHLKATVTINGKDMEAMLDTGAYASVISLPAAAEIGLTPNSPGVEQSHHTSGIGARFAESWIVPVESITIGDETIRNTRMRMARYQVPRATPVLLGADFFLSHRVYVSRSRRKIYFTHNGGPVFRLDDPGAQDGAEAQVASAGNEPTDAGGYARRAAAWAARRDYARAIGDYTKAIELDPKAAAHLHERGRLRMSRDGRLAMADFDAAIALDPNNADILMSRALLRIVQGDERGGLEDYAKAQAAEPEEDKHVLSLANAYGGAGRLDDELALLDRWAAEHPRDLSPNFLNNRCWVRGLLDRELDKALADCDAAIRRAGRISAFLDSRALVLVRLGRLNEAIADYDAALRLQPRDAWYLHMRGVAKMKAGKTAEGKADIDAAAAIDPKAAEQAERYGLKA